MKEKLLRKTILFLGGLYWRARQNARDKRAYAPASGKTLGPEELSNMLEATLDLWLTAGRFADEFETALARRVGVNYALAVNSGSSANLLAVTALTSPKLGEKRLRPGDEVITAAAGFPTTAAPIWQNGLVPVFADIEIPSLQINTAQLEECLSPKTRAVFIAHTLGNPFDLDAVRAFCQKHSLWLIEDNCDALGSLYKGRATGSFGHISTCSFYPAHHITTGEGGAVLTNDRALYRILLSLRDWGRDCWCKPGADNSCQHRFNTRLGKLPAGYDHKYTYSHLGYNLKMTDWQAACGTAQIKKLDAFIRARRENFQTLCTLFKPLEKYFITPRAQEGAEPSWFGFPLTVQEGADKNALCRFLEQNGVGTRQLFAGNLLRQPALTDGHYPLRVRGGATQFSDELTEADFALLPGTETAMNRTFWVGLWPGLTQDDLAKTARVCAAFFERRGKK